MCACVRARARVCVCVCVCVCVYCDRLASRCARVAGILSALYVAGFHHVYLHVKQEPTGRWWEELRGENITVVMLQESYTVFQQNVSWIKHISDLSRYSFLTLALSVI